ncbi:hypothetical protein [Methylophaga thiooxydans]|uniref:hypothetical protein n=1 Tax=Methylophaga thiooxydans TaxID=392484 RepID=UPI00055FAF95|nr:hypothetical protein [Methylophaga thiooxydans]
MRKKWAFIDCLKDVTFENIDFGGYERIILFGNCDLLVPVGHTEPELELGVLNTDAKTQHQMTIVMAYQISQFDTEASDEVQFDIYSDDIASPSIDECLRKANRDCSLFRLPPTKKITLPEAVDNFIEKVCGEYESKTHRPRTLEIYESLLNDSWRAVRGRIGADEILAKLESDRTIKHASNGVFFTF